ncbi:catecholate siderophore receptor [Poseidonocella pacifica]|uniref:Catecholate siderophore receptor n=1 Tax=Poseidonocella pacifica TaxID=871651 RepID=A0A1I0VWR4_9RHOB|nr:TonB-dependent siderophore receptor [Poseidonocella pacifica]SFA80527.1 catecholate siderophore receptor [Poseidonocella pacifica]
MTQSAKGGRANAFPASSVATTLGLLPTLAISAMAVPAAAQQQQSAYDLGEIVVKAPEQETQGYLATESSSAKSTAPLVDTPKSVTVITAAEIRDRGQTSLEEVLRTTPGVTLGAAEGGIPLGTQPVIRGFSAAFDVSVDGIRNASRTTYEAFNLESVEIAKGPSGTTGGRGTTGGSVNLETKKPVEDNFTDTSLTYGTGKFLRGTLDTNRDFGAFSTRLNLMAQSADDLNGREGVTSERYGVAPSLRYQLNGTTSLTAGLYYYESHDLPDYGIPMSTSESDPDYTVGSGTTWDPYEPADVSNENWYGLQDRDFRDLTSKSAFVALDHQLGNGLNWSTTVRVTEDENVYLATKLDGKPDGVLQDARNGNKLTKTQAINSQITGSGTAFGVEHQFAFGVDISREITRTGSVSENGTDPTTSYSNPNYSADWDGTSTVEDFNGKATTITRALYAVDTITFSPEWELSLGLRWDDYRVKSDTVGRGGASSGTLEDQFLNGNIGLVYHPTANSSIYAAVSTSTNPSAEGAAIQGGLDEESAALDPERSYSYELGGKMLVNDSLLVSAAIFRTEKDNARINNALGETELAGRTVSKGIELGIAGQINDRWSVSGGYTYTDAKIEEAGFNGNGTTEYDDDTEVTNVAPHSLSIWTSYDVTEALTVGGGATYTSERNVNREGTTVLPAHWQVDAMARYAFENDLEVQMNVTNLFDETIYQSGRTNDFVNVGSPRTVSLTLNKRF